MPVIIVVIIIRHPPTIIIDVDNFCKFNFVGINI